MHQKLPTSDKKEVSALAGARKPTALVIATGAKHLTKQEIAERLAAEVQPCTDDLTPPTFLTCAEKKRFKKLADQLDKLKIMGETDTDTLARFIVAQTHYEKAVKELRAAEKLKPEERDLSARVTRAALLDKLDKRVDRYFKQATAAATALGLTISARCKLVVPKVDEEKPKENKFAAFRGGAKEA